MGNNFVIKVAKGILQKIRPKLSNPYKKIGISWAGYKYLKHLSEGKERVLDLKGNKISYISPQELLHGLDEIFVEEVYKQKLGATPYILDCGSNIGLSVIYLKSLFPDAIIDAYEPDGINFELLKKNTRLFQNVQLHKNAIWDENTKLNFLEQGSIGSKIDTGVHSISTKEIRAVRLKDLMVKNIDFLKLDIEGAEYRAFKDAAPNLHFVKNLFFEYHGTFKQNNELIEILEIIHAAGFGFYIKEAATTYKQPFIKQKSFENGYDMQLNVFCFR